MNSPTDWARLDAMQDAEIDLSDIPEVKAEQTARGRVRVGGQPVPRGQTPVNLDAVIVAYYKAQAGEQGYQALINETLMAHLKQPDLESVLRRVIREELAAR